VVLFGFRLTGLMMPFIMRAPDLARAITYKGLTVNGSENRLSRSGDPTNPKLVLLHGFPASSHHYRNLIPLLADRFHFIAPDYPGVGDSEMPERRNMPTHSTKSQS
jgi:pimeloyl-ACP methyl ester carboxylesterase